MVWRWVLLRARARHSGDHNASCLCFVCCVCLCCSALDRALAHFQNDRDSWQQLSLCNMNTELSWSRSAADYVALYNSIAMP